MTVLIYMTTAAIVVLAGFIFSPCYHAGREDRWMEDMMKPLFDVVVIASEEPERLLLESSVALNYRVRAQSEKAAEEKALEAARSHYPEYQRFYILETEVVQR